MFDGIGAMVDDWLDLPPKGKRPYYRHRSAALAMSKRKQPLSDSLAFLEQCYEQLDRNWHKALKSGYSNPSSENWRWKRHLELAPGNTSPEVRLERAMVDEYGENWSNQMPTASGLVSPNAGRAAVDIVVRDAADTYELIELKVASDTPLFAAIEILQHGLLWCWSRCHSDDLGYEMTSRPVLAANKLTLTVLAPEMYYERYDLVQLAAGLRQGLRAFCESDPWNIDFRYQAFPACLGDSTGALLVAAADRYSIWQS